MGRRRHSPPKTVSFLKHPQEEGRRWTVTVKIPITIYIREIGLTAKGVVLWAWKALKSGFRLRQRSM